MTNREPVTPCPVCGAIGWQECVSRSGRILTRMHAARTKAERAVGEPGA